MRVPPATIEGKVNDCPQSFQIQCLHDSQDNLKEFSDRSRNDCIAQGFPNRNILRLQKKVRLGIRIIAP